MTVARPPIHHEMDRGCAGCGFGCGETRLNLDYDDCIQLNRTGRVDTRSPQAIAAARDAAKNNPDEPVRGGLEI